jgi:hypothetical protein
MAAAQQGQQKPPSVASQILQQAEQGVEQLPSNLPVSQDMAGGGIIAFAEGGDAEDFDVEAYREQQDEDEYANSLSALVAAAQAAAEEGVSTRKKGKKYAEGGIAGFYNGGSIDEANATLGMGDLEQINPMLARTNVPAPTRFLADGDRLRTEPSYRSWVEEGGLNGDARWETFLALGNAPYESVDLPNDDPRLNPYAPDKPSVDQQYQTAVDRNNLKKAQDVTLSADQEFGDATRRAVKSGVNYLYRGANALGANIQPIPKSETLNPEFIKTFGDKTRSLNLEDDKDPIPSINLATDSQAEIEDPRLASGIVGIPSRDSSKKGIVNLPAAKTASPSVPGAPQGSRATTPAALVNQLADQTGRPRSAYDDFLDEIRAGREDLKTQAQKDKYMAIISAGLGMMSGTSPNAFANIGQGAQAGVASYMASGKQRAAEKAALNKNLLMGRRYQSMEDVANRTADINERRYAAIAAARGTGGDSKSEALLDRQENAFTTRLRNAQATVLSALQAKFGKDGALIDPKGYAKAEQELTQTYVAPVMTMQERFLAKRYPDVFGDQAEMPDSGSVSTRLKVDKNGNIIQ